MFLIDCPRHERRVLVGPRAIEALVNTPDGPVVRWRCPCGARGTHATATTTAHHTAEPAA